MANVLLVAYLLIVLALITVILLQRSEGGGLGIGGGGGLVSARGSANLLTRTTGILAALFMATAIGLTLLNEIDRSTDTILESAAEAGSEEGADSDMTVLDVLNQLQDEETPGEAAPTEEAPAVEAPAEEDAPDLALPTEGSGSQ